MTDVYVLGGGQTDFARNLAKESAGITELMSEVVDLTLDGCSVDPSDIGSVHVGNAFGELFNGQSHLGAMPATVRPALAGMPGSRHDAACAAGGVAILAAMAQIQAGWVGSSLVVGAEQERNVPGAAAAANLGAAAWVGHENEGVELVWPHTFSTLADEYDRRFGLDDAHLRAIAELNLRNAKSNPLAQTRTWEFPPEAFTADDVANPIVAGRVRRTDCSQLTDGAAGVVLASAQYAFEWADARGISLDAVPRVLGWGCRTVGLPLAPKLTMIRGSDHVLPHVRATILDAFSRAGISGAADLDGIETHDCFTPSEYAAIDHFGITDPGCAWQAIEDGCLERDGSIPMNPSGGLIGVGHPVGATGVRMVLDATRQVTGTAGGYQVEGASRFATLNIGGSATTTVCFVIGTR